MKLVALIVEEYKELFKHQIINFSDEYEVEFEFEFYNEKHDSDEDYIPKFTFKKRDQYIENFYQSNIENFSIIAGVNGTGKSSILNMLIHYEILYNKKAEYENLRYCLVFKDENDICLEYSKYFCRDKNHAQIEIEGNKSQIELEHGNGIAKYITNNKYNFETKIGFLASEFDKNFARSSSYDKNIKNGIFPRKYDLLYPINILRAYNNLKKTDFIQSDLRLKLEIRWKNFSDIFEDDEITKENRERKKKVSISQMKYFEKNMHKIIVENRGKFKNEAIYKVWKSIDKLYREGMVSVDHYDNNGSQAFFTTYIVFNGVRNQKVFEDFLISYGNYLDYKNNSGGHEKSKKDFPDIEISMSKGETNVLLLISQILQILSNDNAAGDYIVLIDEIETGMHLEWSRRILGFVVDYIKNEVSEKNSNAHFQFVFTTHSPFMLSDIKPGNVVSLKKEKGKTVVREHTNTFAKNIQEIMNEDMLISKIYGDFALLKINSLINKLREDKIENKEVFLKEIKMISEPILRNKLLDMYHQKFDTSEDLNRTLLDKMNLTTEERQKILDILDKKNN